MDQEKMQQQFLTAYDELGDAVFRHCVFRVSNREEATDIMQETFTRLWEYMRKGNDIQNMKAFTFRTANNLIIDWYRKKKPVALDDEVAHRLPDTEHAVDPEIVADASSLLELLDELEEPYKTAISLRYLDGLGPKEIAEVIGESENAISVRIHRGIKQLQERFESQR